MHIIRALKVNMLNMITRKWKKATVQSKAQSIVYIWVKSKGTVIHTISCCSTTEVVLLSCVSVEKWRQTNRLMTKSILHTILSFLSVSSVAIHKYLVCFIIEHFGWTVWNSSKIVFLLTCALSLCALEAKICEDDVNDMSVNV